MHKEWRITNCQILCKGAGVIDQNIVLRIHKGYFVVKSWCEMAVLLLILSGIQTILPHKIFEGFKRCCE